MMKKIAALLMALLLAGCAYAPAESANESFESMDTFMHIEICGDASAAAAVRAEIERLDSLFSSSDEESDIGRLNREKNTAVESETYELLSMSLDECRRLEGFLDISVYPLVEEWGFISKEFQVPPQERIDALLKNVSCEGIRLSERESGTSEPDTYRAEIGDGMKIDLGAVAKGYAADKARSAMESRGVTAGILNLGGTVAAVGTKSDGRDWKIGIAAPDNTASYFGSVACHDKVVATSGNYERYFEQDGRRYCHIIDPQTGYPVDNGTVSVTVISDSGFRSDALSTALFVMGREKAAEYWRQAGDFDFILLDADNNLWMTDGAKESFQLAKGFDFTINRIE